MPPEFGRFELISKQAVEIGPDLYGAEFFHFHYNCSLRYTSLLRERFFGLPSSVFQLFQTHIGIIYPNISITGFNQIQQFMNRFKGFSL